MPASFHKLTVDIRLGSSLNFEQLLLEAEKVTQPLLWHFDFGGIEALEHPLHHPVQLQSLLLGIEKFAQLVLDKFAKQTKGFLIFEGAIPEVAQVKWDFQTEDQFAAWKKEEGDASFQKRVFVTDLFAEFLTRLSSGLPMETAVLLALKQGEENLGTFAHLANRERFEHFELFIKGSELAFALNSIPSEGELQTANWEELPLGVLLPRSNYADCEGLKNFNALLHDLIKGGKTFRLIPEVFFHEMWYQLDSVIAFSPAVSTVGQRGLCGFAATGGEILLESSSQDSLPFLSQV